MVSKIFNKGQRRILALTILIVWIFSMAYLIRFYDQPFSLALMDSAVHSVLVLGGFFLLENVFRYYIPQKGNLWLAVALPILLSVAILVFGNFLIRYILVEPIGYLHFLDNSIAARGVIIIIIFSAFCILLMLDSRLEDQLKTRNREEVIHKMTNDAELFLLRQQLQPHFLFNSLNSISALIKSKPEQAREMVLQLSEFLRGTIRKDDKKWVTLEEELAYLQLFLDIERVRFGHRLKVLFTLGEKVGFLTVPQLMIQPLLENALKHGLYGTIGEVTIQVIIKQVSGYLEIHINNPFDPGSGKPDGLGFGLQAVKRRLYLLFGRHDLLDCIAKDDVFSVILKIPQSYDQNPYH